MHPSPPPHPASAGETRNIAKFFVEHQQIGWVLLAFTLGWGLLGFYNMPRRKDPVFPVRMGLVVTPWQGVSALEVEQQLTKLVEEKVAENTSLHPSSPYAFGMRSISLPGLSVIYVQLDETLQDTKKEFADIKQKLDSLAGSLPTGAGPIQFYSDFGDTTALMMSVASPRIPDSEIELRAREVRRAIERVRPAEPRDRVAIVYSFPPEVPAEHLRRGMEHFVQFAVRDGIIRDPRAFDSAGFIGVDGSSEKSDAEIDAYVRGYLLRNMQTSTLHPDAWGPAVIRDLGRTAQNIKAVAGDKYTYRQLDDFTEIIARGLTNIPQASKYQRSGVLPEEIRLEYSQEKLSATALQPAQVVQAVQGHNTLSASGAMEAGGKYIYLRPAENQDAVASLGGIIIGHGADGSAMYLRDAVDIARTYQTPARYLNFLSQTAPDGSWHRARAVTVAIFMRTGSQSEAFGHAIDARLQAIKPLLPADLIYTRTIDQPRQVRDSIGLFMSSLAEAVILVIIVSLIGFFDWRSALLMALAIPITLAMTFGFMSALGLDLQMVSIASLIIALGLLVDDPVAAADAIKRSLGEGKPARTAAWLGPTQLSRAIMYATITNIAAYLPFLILEGNNGTYIRSLPIVVSCSLVASRIVSMTFIPLLGYYILRAEKHTHPPLDEIQGLMGSYVRTVRWCMRHRWKVLALCGVGLMAAFTPMLDFRTEFFPNDVQYWSTVNVILPNNASLAQTNEVAHRVEQVIRDKTAEFGRNHPHDGDPSSPLRSLSTFVGAGGPRFWFSIAPEFPQSNYAQIIIEIKDKAIMPALAGYLQTAVTAAISDARVEVNQLGTGLIEFPVEIMISSYGAVGPGQAAQAEEIRQLRRLAAEVEDIFRPLPQLQQVRTDWQDETLDLVVDIDAEKARLAGFRDTDTTAAIATALNGQFITMLREDNKQYPVVARLAPEEISRLSDLRNLYVYPAQRTKAVPLAQFAEFKPTMSTQRIVRQDRLRTISVIARPKPGLLPADVLKAAKPKLKAFEKKLPTGFRMVIGGENAQEAKGFMENTIVMTVSTIAIFLALVLQFNSFFKPLIVFSAVPFGVGGAVLALYLTGYPFGFMAFLAIISLIGVIVSHVIVFFDFIEEMHEAGAGLEESLITAGIMRMRPVMVTVGATVLAFVPLAMHGGPLWEPLCYAQMGGLTVAVFITLVLMPVLYIIAVRDLKIIRWEHPPQKSTPPLAAPGSA